MYKTEGLLDCELVRGDRFENSREHLQEKRQDFTYVFKDETIGRKGQPVS